MIILAIETSCDETAVAIVDSGDFRKKSQFRVRANIVSSQVKIHAQYGGVVPNVAKREHQRVLVPLLLHALKKAGLLKNKRCGQKQGIVHGIGAMQHSTPEDRGQKVKEILAREVDLCNSFEKKILPLATPDIDAIAVTYGPGLAPALWVGVNCAKALAYVWGKSLIPVNHMEGHLFSAFLQKGGKKNSQVSIPYFRFPLLALLVSGGHTELVLMRERGKYHILGETLDDAAGEAFDKIARMLGLGYPGGPAISALAEIARSKSLKIKKFNINLPRPMLNSKNYNFSFSGLKTAVLYMLKRMHPSRIKKLRSFIAKECEDAIVDVLVAKTIRAAKIFGVKTIVLGGGVAANLLLRRRLHDHVKANLGGVKLFLPSLSVTGDNALMIAFAAFMSGKKKAPTQVEANANVRLS